MDSPRADEAAGGALSSEPAEDRPLVSVVVVNYNGGDALEGCLDALVAGSGDAVEVLVVDNASSDGSAEIAEAAADRHE